MSSATKLTLTLLLFAVALPLGAAEDEMARRLFVAAEELEQSGQIEPAKQSYRQIVEGAPESRFADDALLALARLEWPAAGVDELGTSPVDPARIERARELLEIVVERYVASDSAAEASWRLALLLLEPGHAGRDPDAAVARLVSLPTVYPDSPFAPRALGLAASIDQRAGRGERARSSAFELLSRWPTSEEGAHAWFALGRLFAEDGEWGDALHALGRAQVVAGAGALRERAARFATLVDRFAFRVDSPGAPLEATPESMLTVPERPDDLAAGEDGTLALGYEREGFAEIIAPDGTRSRKPAPGTVAVAVDAWGGVWRGGSVIATPEGTGSFATRTDLEIVGLVPVDASLVWVLDERDRQVLLLRRDGSVAQRAALPDRARPSSIATDTRGGVWVVEERERTLHRFDPEGLVLARVDLSGRLERASDLAADALGNVYVLDERARRVEVFDKLGTPLFGVALPGDGPLAIERPEAIAVDGAGAVAVLDSRNKRIVWLR